MDQQPTTSNHQPSVRYKLTVAYRGTRYHGWQSQRGSTGVYTGPQPADGHGLPTVQETLTRTLAGVLNHPLSIQGSSRTDSGVHAKGQVCHVDTIRTQIEPEKIRAAVNARLPGDILVRSIERVPDGFDARRSTISKRYQYLIWHAPDRPPFFNDLVWHRWQQLKVDAMREACGHLVGTHDFTSFVKPGHGRENAVRTIDEFSLSYKPPRLVLGVRGGGFLWHQIRIMVGTLVQIGLGNYAADDVPRMLEAKDRKAAGPTAPPYGLYLHWIKHRDEVPAGENGVT